MKVLVGSDPEIFLTNGQDFVSAYGVIPGTKEEPHLVDKGAVQVDGCALEFNINPASTPEEFDKNITVVLTQLEEMVKKHDPSLKLVFEPFAEFDPIYFQFLPFDCKILGCEPDFSHLGVEKTPSENLVHSPFRTAAGHIHVGWRETGNPKEDKHFDLCKRIARDFLTEDGFIPLTKNERERAKYYGVPGSFRPKMYGVELRSPSNLWVKSSESRKKMFENVVKRMERIE